MKKSNTLPSMGLSTILLFIIGNVCFLITNVSWDSIQKFEKDTITQLINIYGILGIIVTLLIFRSWKKISGLYFSPYTIFFIFILIFNYGQFIMWSLGIHYKGELGTTTFIRYMDSVTLLRIEMITIVCIIFFHIGASISVKVKGTKITFKNYSKEAFCKAMAVVSPIILVFSFSIVMYEALMSLKVAISYGYSALYYGDQASTLNPLFKYISYMFFPSLIGTWIGNKLSKKSFYLISCLFLVYMIVNMLSGDRGSWIYYLIILVWCYLNYIKKPKLGTLLKVIVPFALVISITSVLVKFREIGFNNITSNEFGEVLSDLPFIFIKPFFEMGQSARVLGIILQDNLHETWEYGNTYAAAILGMVLPRTKVWFGYPDFYLENWISQSYLFLEHYGVGFSIVAEAYLNGGLLFSPIIMMIIGGVMGKILLVRKDLLINQPEKLFFTLSSLGALLPICRGSVELGLRIWFFGVVIPLFLYYILVGLMKKTSSIQGRESNE
ncbi:O-antigen polysaccharide polymerase Wzy [Bacillus pacificus]|uniref:O-antigen polysaccharide polymerase Wzy n=1 Tax=Bacillus pacificus TaxID=2026187 RepID=UPI003D1FBA51